MVLSLRVLHGGRLTYLPGPLAGEGTTTLVITQSAGGL